MQIRFVVPGNINLPTGGYRYDRNIIEQWNTLNVDCVLHSLQGDFPFPTNHQRDAAIRSLSDIPDQSVAVIDGLAGGAMPELLENLARRMKVVSLIHHPLCLENGITSAEKEKLEQSEKSGLEFVSGVITTSTQTAKTTAELFDYPQERIRSVEPGVDRGPIADPKQNDIVNLICVGSVVERKGHMYLIEALAKLKHLDWNLDCYGMADTGGNFFKQVSRKLVESGVENRISFHGVVTQEVLETAYSKADLFVLPSLYEGYGMAYAEAIVRGLPVIGTMAGAIPDTVPRSCGILVEPKSVEQLRSALETMITKPSKRAKYHLNALHHEPNFPTWRQSAQKFLQLLELWA